MKHRFINRLVREGDLIAEVHVRIVDNEVGGQVQTVESGSAFECSPTPESAS